jgi:hypothetical protein
MPVHQNTYIVLTHDTIPPLESGPHHFLFFAPKKSTSLKVLFCQSMTFDNSIPKSHQIDPELLHT